MSLRLNLVANPKGRRASEMRKISGSYSALSKKVFERDSYTCRYCDFKAASHNHIVNADGNYANNDINNLLTACPFCAQCFFLESVGMGGSGGGYMIYLPELEQNFLNAMCHVLFLAISNESEYSDIAKSIYRSLKIRTEIVEKELGDGSSNPVVIGRLMLDMEMYNVARGTNPFYKLRLLPARSAFVREVANWASERSIDLGRDMKSFGPVMDMLSNNG